MKQYNVGIIGYGWAAEAQIPALNATALAQVTSIWSSCALDARQLSAKHGGASAAARSSFLSASATSGSNVLAAKETFDGGPL